LLDEVDKDGGKIVLLPFRPAPPNQFEPAMQRFMIREEDAIKKYAEDRGYPFAPFPDTTISPGNWVDNCHLNAAGEREKAEHVAPFIRLLLEDPTMIEKVKNVLPY
ncbi:SGNH/GDSL hydrolase family protein, partial [Candidatus Sumerlaeota bacterium]|nr:SGNH/GDSL hydrolase family protein [Candidatus Sumerlaeota bacterium]